MKIGSICLEKYIFEIKYRDTFEAFLIPNMELYS